ncbi:hypothetical protein OESDEN_09836 [Oesophagostomum dentatum]|uniref:Chitin synthase chs-1/2 N-terminal putative transporter domain-containing protein n=1 Tax=Oesophagostomum dentatum TaxID=61180 RepID=A0A0B1T3E6_OESDE|nr:hypothetical protein OESDEN_09836 [Oesophagostomum dentatum]
MEQIAKEFRELGLVSKKLCNIGHLQPHISVEVSSLGEASPRFWHDASLQVLKLATFVVLFVLTLGSAVVAKVVTIETLHAIGVGILVFRIFPDLDAVTATELTNAMCFVPAVLSLVSRRPSRVAFLLVIVDIIAIAAQSSGFWAFPMFIPSLEKHSVAIPWCLLLISLAWWQNFVHDDSVFPPVRALAKMKMEDLLQRDPFGEKLITITGHNLNQTQIDKFLARMSKYGGADYDEVTISTTKKPWTEPPQVIEAGDYTGARVRRQQPLDDEDELPSAFNIYDNYVELNQFTSPYDALWIVLVQVTAVFLCYHSSKFACKVMMQRLGFALPMALAVPTAVLVLSTTCTFRSVDSCYMTNALTKQLADLTVISDDLGAVLEMLLFLFVLQEFHGLTTNMDLVELVPQSMLDHHSFVDAEARETGEE